MDQQVRDWVEQVGLWAEHAGLPRSTGRVLGWLLACDPPEASAADLAEGLAASTGSVSQATRQLVATGLVEKVAVKGDRRTYYRVPPEALVGLLEAEVPRITAMRELGEDGMAALDLPDDDPRAARLRAWTDVATFFERQWPALIERWRQEQ